MQGSILQYLQLAKESEPIVALLLAVCTSIIGSFFAGMKFGAVQTRRKLLSDREEKRFSELYAVLWALFLDRHVEGSSINLAPYFRDRLNNAQTILTERKFSWRTLRRAARALFDKRVSSSYEMAFGTFPTSQILTLLRGREHLADSKLLSLVKAADLASIEARDGHVGLHPEEIRLLDHIHDEYQRLSKRLRA